MAVYFNDNNKPPNFILLFCVLICILFWYLLTVKTLKLINKGVSHEFKEQVIS